MSERQTRRIHLLLTSLVAFDATLVVWAFAFPDLWFQVFHGVPYAGNDPEAFLRRCGANWAGFFVAQLLAWRRWRREVGWLAVVSGVRLSDIFTDITYVTLCEHRTGFALATLPLMGIINMWLAWRFWRAYVSTRQGAAGQRGMAPE